MRYGVVSHKRGRVVLTAPGSTVNVACNLHSPCRPEVPQCIPCRNKAPLPPVYISAPPYYSPECSRCPSWGFRWRSAAFLKINTEKVNPWEKESILFHLFSNLQRRRRSEQVHTAPGSGRGLLRPPPGAPPAGRPVLLRKDLPTERQAHAVCLRS